MAPLSEVQLVEAQPSQLQPSTRPRWRSFKFNEDPAPNEGKICIFVHRRVEAELAVASQNETMCRTATKLLIEFPLCVHDQIRFGSSSLETQIKRRQHEPVAIGEAFCLNFCIEWADLDALDELAQSVSSEGLSLTVNGGSMAIDIALKHRNDVRRPDCLLSIGAARRR